MNKDNLLKEGFFDKLRKIFGLSSAQERELKKDKQLNSIINNLNKDVKDIEKIATKIYKRYGIKKKINIRKYQLKDFL